jgi:hypothetical protein
MTTNILWIQETFLRLWYQIIIRVLRRLRNFALQGGLSDSCVQKTPRK